MFAGLDGRDIGRDCMVLKSLRQFACSRSLLHRIYVLDEFNAHFSFGIWLFHFFILVGSHACWTIISTGVYGTLCARLILHDTSIMVVWSVVSPYKHSKKKRRRKGRVLFVSVVK